MNKRAKVASGREIQSRKTGLPGKVRERDFGPVARFPILGGNPDNILTGAQIQHQPLKRVRETRQLLCLFALGREIIQRHRNPQAGIRLRPSRWTFPIVRKARFVNDGKKRQIIRDRKSVV